MMIRLRYAPLAAALFASTAQAQVPTRTDYCNADPLSRRVADATALVIPRAYLKLNTRGDAYELTTHPFDYIVGGTANICPDQPYYEQIRAIQGRTGFLIGDQTLVTAPHANTANFDLNDWAILFDWRWIEDGPQTELSPDRNCKLSIDPANIPLNAVYHFDGTTAPYNPVDIDPSDPADYLIVQLDRPVPGVTPLPLRRSGQPLLGDPLIVPGFPTTLPLKIAGGGSVQRVGPTGIGIGEAWIDSGSSGSPVFNTRAELVESVVAHGFLPFIWELDSTGTCLEANFNTVKLGHRFNYINNTPIKDLPGSALPPSTSLQVAPLNLVTHRMNGNDVTNRTTTFEVMLPANAPAAVDYMVKATALGPPAAGFSGTALSVQPDATLHTIQPGGTQQFTVEVPFAQSLCELIDAEVRVTPNVPGAYASVIPHRFEVDWRDFDVTPDTNWTFSGFAPPYPTRQLTISNPSPVAQTFTVSAPSDWLRVNNAASVQLSVPAGGTATATLSVVSTADLYIPPGKTGRARVTVSPDAAECVGRGSEEIDVAFTNGVAELTALNTAEDFLPRPTGGATHGTPQEYSFDLSTYAGETVADVDVSVSFLPTSAPSLPANAAPQKTMIELVSPNGGSAHVLTLWDGQTAPTGYLSGIPGYGVRLNLNDEATPPLAGTPLSDVDGEDMGGIWKVRLFNRTQDDVLPLEVMIRVTRTP